MLPACVCVCECIPAIDRDLIYDPVESTEMPYPIIWRGFAVQCKKFANTRITRPPPRLARTTRRRCTAHSLLAL